MADCHFGNTYLLADNDCSSALIHHHTGHFIGRNWQTFKFGKEARRGNILRPLQADGLGIARNRHPTSVTTLGEHIDRIGGAYGRREIRITQLDNHFAVFAEIACNLALDQRAIRNTARCRNALGYACGLALG
ncbi:hypothetical protein D3C80_1308620 [compost metagenome]